MSLTLDDVLAARERIGVAQAVPRVRISPPPLNQAISGSTARDGDLGCVNPEFHELPQERSSFRVLAQVRGSA